MKNILSSKTIWFNTLTVLTVLATSFGYVPNQDFASDVSAILLLVSPLVNIVLRFVTNKGVTLK